MRAGIAALVLLPLLLAGCSRTPNLASMPQPTDPGVAECRDESTMVASRALARESWPSNSINVIRIDRERQAAESRAFTDCLRRRGLARGGGVEPVQRPNRIPNPLFD